MMCDNLFLYSGGKMIRTIIKKELLDNLLSFRFIITMLLCVVLIPLGIYVSIKEYQNSMNDYQQSMNLYHESIQGMKNAIDVEAKGLRPPSPFSIFAGGLDKFLPNEILSTRNEGLQLGNNSTMDAPLSILFGKMDFLFSVSVIMSLLAILFTFDATTREKEEGTLRLALSNSIPRHQMIIGKYLGNFITFLIPFTIAMLIGIILVSLSGVLPLFRSSNLLRLITITGISLLFVSVFFNLGLMVSSLTRRSLTAQITLLFLWVLLIFAMPRVSNMVAGVIYPVKTQQTLDLEKTLVRKNIRDEKANALRNAFQQSMSGDPDEGAKSYDEIREPIVQALREKEMRLMDAIDSDFQTKKNIQHRISSILSRLSPLASLTFATTELANTGLLQMDNLISSSRQFHNDVSREIHSKGYKDDITGAGMRMSMSYVNADDIPQFQYQTTSLSNSLQACWVDILLLVLFNVLFFAGAYVGFLRYDVR
jgi:ABC-type transport system involved in multi-copper enzyme maturation permease subunit